MLVHLPCRDANDVVRAGLLILVRGMEEGWFTGKALRDYLPGQTGAADQFAAARRIINGTDRADMIAAYAIKFQAALTAGGWS
ncbi:hypothetical protein [Sphingomonas sp. NFR04]|uniref:hypothetical protein n=1 Tax=Sphingomonas sp. NFR04 TaxID=1566283 RepID=UPI000B87AA96|nr:hypothetical protein [Sphingomonas sp. NFR04]